MGKKNNKKPNAVEATNCKDPETLKVIRSY